MDPEMRDAIREAVLDVLREQEAHHAFHRRAPLARQRDPEGREWISATASKAQALGILVGFLASIFGGIWASMSVRDTLVVIPRVEAIVEERMAHHEEAVRETMAQVRPTIATKSELDELSKALAVSRAEREQQYTAIQAQLDRIERRLERMGR